MAASDAHQRDRRQDFLAAAFIDQRIEHHDDHAENGKNNFRQDADVVDALRNAF